MMRHGEALPSCSICVRMISSPGSNRPASTRVIMNVSVVMFAPKITSRSLEALKKSAIARCASADVSVANRDVWKLPPMLALNSTRACIMRSSTTRGTWVPAGLSRYTRGFPSCVSASAGNCSRTASMSIAMARQ